MFGFFRRKQSGWGRTDLRRAFESRLGRTGGGHDFGFAERGDRGTLDTERVTRTVELATYDRLGQTLVSTPLVDALSGPDAGALASELFDKIQAAHTTGRAGDDPDRPAGVRHVVLDLQNVQYMDSMCVGVLVELLTVLKEAGGRIALANASSNIECLFKLTRLDRVFPICRDVMKAIDVVEREEM